MRIFTGKENTNQEKLESLLKNTREEGSCLVWTRCFNTDGYPRMAGNVKVHREVCRLSGKDINHRVVRHTCDNIRCVNPNHLIPGNHLDNMRDRKERGRYEKVITKDVVTKTRLLLQTEVLSNKQIANLIGIDPRRVSDIKLNLYSAEGEFLGRG